MPRYRTLANRLLRPPRPKYTLFDSFSVDAAAGAVNGTYSDKSHSLRTVVDTNGKISVAGGLLDFATGAAANDGLWAPVEARRLGKVFHAKVTPSNTDGVINVGWDAQTSGAILDCLQFAAAGVLQIVANGGTAVVVGAYTATAYEVDAIMRATGIYWYIKGGAFTYWTFLRPTALGTAAAYPAITAGSATSIFTANPYFTSPKRIYVPEPIAADTFTRADGPLGVSDSVGPDSQACVSRTWSFPAGTAAISGNAAVISPTAGAALISGATLNGNMETGDPPTGWTAQDATLARNADKHGGDYALLLTATASPGKAGRSVNGTIGAWCQVSCWAKATAGDSANILVYQDGGGYATMASTGTSSTSYVRILITFRNIITGIGVSLRSNANGDICWFDDVELAPLTLASLFSSLSDAKTADVMVDVKVAALTTGTQAGLVARLDDATTPANFIIAYFDGAGNAKCDECVAGVYAALITAASVYAANATLRLDVSGTAVRLYTITSAGVAVLVGTAATNVATGTKHGIFSTFVSNTFALCQVFPKGTGNEIAALDSL